MCVRARVFLHVSVCVRVHVHSNVFVHVRVFLHECVCVCVRAWTDRGQGAERMNREAFKFPETQHERSGHHKKIPPPAWSCLLSQLHPPAVGAEMAGGVPGSLEPGASLVLSDDKHTLFS